MTARDKAALDAFTANGQAFVPSAASKGELSPQHGAFVSLARHLARLSVAVDSGDASPAKALSFKTVFEHWPESWVPSAMPSATLDAVFTDEIRTMVRTPLMSADGTDILSADGLWGLWLVGEDQGEGNVSIFTAFHAHTHALHEAVVEALQGDLDTTFSLQLPMPEAFIPPPFRAQMGIADFPICDISAANRSESGGAENEGQARSNAWRMDVRFRWRAPRIEARPRLNDLAYYTVPKVGPPGQEIRLCPSRDATISIPLPPSS